ncbi:MAG: hypothetical protein ABIQ33_07125 [Caldimonas sp.]
MSRRVVRGDLALATIALLALLGAVFLAAIGIDSLEYRNDFQFFADSPTYHEAARGDLEIDGVADLVGIAGNFLGPLVILKLAGENYYAVLILNALLLAFSVLSLSRSLRLDASKFLIVLLLNPITISSLLSVNKETLSLVFVALLVRGYAARSVATLLLAALVSVLVRWQLTVLLAIAVAMLSGVNPLRERRIASLALLVAAFSLAYLLFEETLTPIRLTFQDAAAEYEGSGFYEQLVAWQDQGWYWAILPLKAAHLLFGLGLRLDRLIAPADWYNDVWQLLHSTSLLVLFLMVVRRGRFTPRNDLVYLALIYVAVFAITPIYTPRYFYPVYVLWAAALCSPDRLAPILRRRAVPRMRRKRPLAPSPT